MRRIAAWPLVLVLMVCCGDDSARSSGEDGTGDSTVGPTEPVEPTADATGDDGTGDCDDLDPCTLDVQTAGGCEHEPQLTNECRPAIEIDHPPRGATLVGDGASPQVVVTGTVTSGLGEITSLVCNGEPVTVAGDGSFAHEIAVDIGGNVLVCETEDDAGNARRRVQSFLWSTGYRKPTSRTDAPVAEGLAFWLAQESLDDGDHGMPLDDLATALELALSTFDIGAFADPDTAIASSAGYDVYLTDLALASAEVALQGADGGIALRAGLTDIVGDLRFDCTNFGCELAGGDGTGGVSVTRVEVTGTLLLSAGPDHLLQANLVDVDAIVNPDDVEIWSDNVWTNFLLSIVEVFIHDSLVADLEGALEDQLQSNLGPALANGLSALTLATTFEFPNLGNARKSIPVDLTADFAQTDFHDGVAPPAESPPQGGAVVLRAGGAEGISVSRYDNLGVPDRDGCGVGVQGLAVPREAPLEISLADDTLNQLLYAGWRGGLLEFPLSGINGGGLIENLQVDVSGMLAPTVSDCGPNGELLATIGDIDIDASFEIGGNPVTFDAYTSLVMKVEIRATENGIQLDLAEVVRVETELTADEANIPMEASYTELLEAQLVDGLLGQLGTTGFGAISLPQIDLSGMLGLPPGSAVLVIHADDVVRSDGTSVISAHL
jgi:hypothetical protein